MIYHARLPTLLASIDHSALEKKLGKLSQEQFEEVKAALRELLDL